MTDIAERGALGQKATKQRHTAQERAYYEWMHVNGACVLTLTPSFQIAHTGGLAQGKGMSRKAALNTCLPLYYALHHLEERHRARFWEAVLPDYLDHAAALYECFKKGGDIYAVLAEANRKSNTDSVRDMLAGQFNW